MGYGLYTKEKTKCLASPTRSKVTEGSRNLKSTSRHPDYAPFDIDIGQLTLL